MKVLQAPVPVTWWKEQREHIECSALLLIEEEDVSVRLAAISYSGDPQQDEPDRYYVVCGHCGREFQIPPPRPDACERIRKARSR